MGQELEERVEEGTWEGPNNINYPLNRPWQNSNADAS